MTSTARRNVRLRAFRPHLFSAIVLPLLALPAPAQVLLRSIDGSDNNPLHPQWGAAHVALQRLSKVDYGDLISTPAGSTRVSAREVSNAIHAQSGDMPSPHAITDYVWQWGQFIDHDIDLTEAAAPPEPFDIQVPVGDPWFDPTGTGSQLIPLDRSLHDGGSSVRSPRQQINAITSWIDGSMVYGSDLSRALELRALDGQGLLATSEGNLLPFNLNGFPNAPSASDPTFFLAGDVRANEQVGLTAMHTLFMREHNFIAARLRRRLPGADGSLIYMITRAIVGAEIQHITYNEWLPVLLGSDALRPYSGWDPEVNATIANSFSTAGFRFGHTMLSPSLLRLNASGRSIAEGPIALQDAFFNPAAILDEGGIEPLLRGLAGQTPQDIDVHLIDDVRNFLFGPPGAGGFDLASLNVQRGRDHGLCSYNQLRLDHGLEPAEDWGDVTSDASLAASLESTFGSPDDMDPWTGVLAEDPLPGALVGELAHSIIKGQFERLRDGDRYWYQIATFGPIREFVEDQTLASVIRRNTDIGDELGDHVFLSLP